MPEGTPVQPEKDPERVRAMFARIAHRYDLLNRLMTGGQDVRWRREVIRRAGLEPGHWLLDIGAGTGDLAFEALRQQPRARVVAADFTLPMMLVGRRRPGSHRVLWTAADTLRLPFPESTFDAVVSGFLLRNVADLPQALREHYRVLKPGGRWVALETVPPPRNWLWPFIAVHFRVVIPLMGRLIAGDADAYRYLPRTSERFLTAAEMLDLLARVGFEDTGVRLRMFATVAIYWARKPA